MPHAYTDDQLVEQPAKRLLSELGWSLAQPHPHPAPLPAGEGVWVDEIGLFGRETKGEVVLVSRLRAAQSALPNPHPGLSATLLPVGEGPGDEGAQLTLPPETITAAVDEMTRDRSAMHRTTSVNTH